VGFGFMGFFGRVVRVFVWVLGVSSVFWEGWFYFFGDFYCILGFLWALGVVGS